MSLKAKSLRNEYFPHEQVAREWDNMLQFVGKPGTGFPAFLEIVFEIIFYRRVAGGYDTESIFCAAN